MKLGLLGKELRDQTTKPLPGFYAQTKCQTPLDQFSANRISLAAHGSTDHIPLSWQPRCNQQGRNTQTREIQKVTGESSGGRRLRYRGFSDQCGVPLCGICSLLSLSACFPEKRHTKPAGRDGLDGPLLALYPPTTSNNYLTISRRGPSTPPKPKCVVRW